MSELATPTIIPIKNQQASISAEELACALLLVNARSIAGQSDPLLSPNPAQEMDHQLGLEKLKRNGGMRPGEQPDTWQLNEELLHAVLILADPSFVVRTAQSAPPQARALYHYLAPDGIVELAQLVNEQYAIALVQDLTTMIARAASLLEAKGSSGSAPDNMDQITGPRGEIIVARARRNQLEAGRKALIYGHHWLTYRRSADTADTETRPLDEANIRDVIEGFLAYLGGAPQI